MLEFIVLSTRRHRIIVRTFCTPQGMAPCVRYSLSRSPDPTSQSPVSQREESDSELKGKTMLEFIVLSTRRHRIIVRTFCTPQGMAPCVRYSLSPSNHRRRPHLEAATCYSSGAPQAWPSPNLLRHSSLHLGCGGLCLILPLNDYKQSLIDAGDDVALREKQI